MYSEDFSLIGSHPYTVTAYLTDYPSLMTQAPDATAMIEFVDPCLDPQLV